MAEYRIRRDNDVDLTFSGTLLSDVSSREEGSQRWTEIRLYRTDSGRYVTEQVGKSLIPGEVDRTKVTIVESAEAVKRSLRRKDEIEYLTHLALDALETAAEQDDGLASALVERI